MFKFRAQFIATILLLIFALAALHTPVQAGGDVLSVEGPRIIRNGQWFVPNGVQIVGLVAPVGALRNAPRLMAAREHLSEQELRNAFNWNANTIRFQLSQPGLDPQDPLYSTQYVSEVQRAVQIARNLGFIVIASIQDQNPSGERVRHKMPIAATERSLLTLAQLFNSDRGVMYELFNEPALYATPDNWRLWRDGGNDPEGGEPIVGMQTLINAVRNTGSQNVLIIDGLQWAQTFADVPPITDPAQKIVYGVHPYFGHLDYFPNVWELQWGYLTAQRCAVAATEWCAMTGPQKPEWRRGLMGDQMAAVPERLLNFLQAHGIGIIGWAFDLPGTIVSDFNGTPTVYQGYAWYTVGGGPGSLLKSYFEQVNR